MSITALSRAIESPTIAELSESIAGIKLGRSQKDLENAKKIALRRSGARGAEARKALLKAEAKVKEDEERSVNYLLPVLYHSLMYGNGNYRERNSRTDFVDAAISVEANELMAEIQVTLDAVRS